ncbi:MAG: hypothetical protein H6843_13135 [Rhodospirillaceae bacterium]|nr:hypothetical protein [Rhodospirillaceae bacterium]
MTYEEWEAQLKKFTQECWDDFHKAGGRKGAHGTEEFEKMVEKRIAKWVETHPPPAGAVTKTVKAGKSSAQAIEELNAANKSAQAMKVAEGERAMMRLRRAKNMGRGIEGVTNLSTIVGVTGTVGLGTAAVVIAKAAFKMWVEDQILNGAIKVTEQSLNAIELATMPNTVAQAETMYQAYVQSCHRITVIRGGMVIRHDEPVLSREHWLAKTYGVRWDALSK